jgi:hypothetical protein
MEQIFANENRIDFIAPPLILRVVCRTGCCSVPLFFLLAGLQERMALPRPAGRQSTLTLLHCCNNGWPFFFSRFALPFASLGPVAGATLNAGIFGHFKACPWRVDVIFTQ